MTSLTQIPSVPEECFDLFGPPRKRDESNDSAFVNVVALVREFYTKKMVRRLLHEESSVIIMIWQVFPLSESGCLSFKERVELWICQNDQGHQEVTKT